MKMMFDRTSTAFDCARFLLPFEKNLHDFCGGWWACSREWRVLSQQQRCI